METESINLTSIQKTAMSVLTSPSSFFREMPKTGGFVEPLIFMVIMGVISGLIQTIFSIISLNVAGGMAMGVASIILAPIVAAIFGFVGAAILFILWKLLGSQESYETAYRCGAYLSVLMPIITVLGLIPYLGSAVGIALYVTFLVMASVEVHKIPSQKAWLVFGIIGAILIIMNISAQITARKFSREAVKFKEKMEETSKAMKKQAEEMQRQAEEARKAAEEMQKQLERK
ncbi:MAG: YIP1 family protein [Desulfobacterales bacterium]|nr:YIP1 family protein [Desulfobacterales bacterium]